MNSMQLRRTLVLIVACASIALAMAPAQADGSPCTTYQPFFDAIHDANSKWADGQAASGHGSKYYSFSYILGGTLAMFEGSHDSRYLDRMFHWSDAMIGSARIIDSRGKKNWSGTWSSPWANAPIAFMLEDLQGSVELARLARITLSDYRLKSAYGTRAQKAYRFVKDDIVDKWLYTRNAAPWFRNVAHDYSKLYSDKVALLVRLLVDLYQIDGNVAYAALASDLLEAFKHRLDPYNDSSLIWDLAVSGKVLDTSHANRMPYMAVDAHAAGIEITSLEIKGLSNLLTRVIWDGSTTSPRFTNYIDGYNGSVFGRPAWGVGQIYSGWVTLGAYDAGVQQVATAVLNAIIAGVRNPSLEYMSSVYGKIALAGYVTRNKRIANTCF
jgi:Ni/Co efflux regulator RcnB